MLLTSLVSDLRRDIRTAREMHLPWWLLLLGALGSAFTAALFDHFGKLYLALPVLNTVAVFGYLIALRRGLWTRMWFWITLAIFAILHFPLVLLIPWTTKWVPPFAIATIDTVDFCLVLSILSVVGKSMGQTEGIEQ